MSPLPKAAGLTTLAIASLAVRAGANGAATSEPQILTQDVDRFYEVYDAAGGHPTADELQRQYIDLGSDGLHQFAKLRTLSGETLSKALAKQPDVQVILTGSMTGRAGVHPRLCYNWPGSRAI